MRAGRTIVEGIEVVRDLDRVVDPKPPDAPEWPTIKDSELVAWFAERFPVQVAAKDEAAADTKLATSDGTKLAAIGVTIDQQRAWAVTWALPSKAVAIAQPIEEAIVEP